MLEASGDTPVSRTQEARVLVTAREMKDRPLHEWLIPQLNGQTRLRKPPLAYWLSATSFNIFGVSARTGRLPMLLAGWLTVGITFAVGRRIVGKRAALLGAGAMAGSWLFFKHAMLAETDILMTCGLTAAIYAAVRATDGSTAARDDERKSQRGANVWWHLAAVAVALAALAKGPQAGCFFLVLVITDAMRRQWRAGWTISFLKSGAIATLLLIAVPWFAYAIANTEGGQLTDDLVNSASGGVGHAGPPWQYVGMLLGATVPWTPLVLVALGIAVKSRRKRPLSLRASARSVLIAWGLAMFVPLLLWGNKQSHYLLPLIPVLMLCVGAVLVDLSRHATTGSKDAAGRLRHLGRGWLVATIVALLIVCPVVPLFAWWKGQFLVEDVYECFAGLLVAAVLAVLHRIGRATLAGAAVVASVATFSWRPTSGWRR